jgi:hypothetical protein
MVLGDFHRNVDSRNFTQRPLHVYFFIPHAMSSRISSATDFVAVNILSLSLQLYTPTARYVFFFPFPFSLSVLFYFKKSPHIPEVIAAI